MNASAHDQSRSMSPELFQSENKRYSGYKRSYNSDFELPRSMPNKDNNNITQRRKSFVKSKTLTDKVRSPVPDNISVQRPKNMIKPATRGPKVFPH